jgi:hypothetical protein
MKPVYVRVVRGAVVRGDVAFVDRVTPPDFRFGHGDGWTRGGPPIMSDDKAAFLKRVDAKEPQCRHPRPAQFDLVRAGLCEAQRPVAVPIALHRARAERPASRRGSDGGASGRALAERRTLPAMTG